MPSLFPCNNLAEAYVIRGWLAAHDIEVHVVHENAQILYPTCAFPVQLAIHEGDFEEISELIKSAREPLPDDFALEESSLSPVPEQPSGSAGLGICESVLLFPLLGLALGLVFAVFSALSAVLLGFAESSSASPFADQNRVGATMFTFARAGLVASVPVWLSIKWAQSCRRHASGELPLSARWMVFAVLMLEILYEFYLI